MRAVLALYSQMLDVVCQQSLGVRMLIFLLASLPTFAFFHIADTSGSEIVKMIFAILTVFYFLNWMMALAITSDWGD